jgi:acyl dehydratase
MTTEQPETLVTQEMHDTKNVWSEPRTSWQVSATDIRKWAQAVYWPEVPPRIYWDEEYAKGTKWGGIIAPQEFNPFAWPLEGSYGQATALAEVKGTPPPETARPMGSGPGSNAMNGGQTVKYYAPIRPGDVITSTSALVDWNERQTRLGLTMFVTNETRWTNQNGELVKVTSNVSIRY